MNGYRPQGYRNRLIVRRLPANLFCGPCSTDPRHGSCSTEPLRGSCSNRGSMCSTLIFGALLFAPLAALLSAQNSGDTQPSLIYRSEPEYSAEATRARVQATVTLSVTVGEDGKAHDVKVQQGAGFGLDEKAIDAMDKWRFHPGTHSGHPASVPANIEMNFD